MIGRSVMFGSRPPENDSLWGQARSRGFEVEVFDRNAANREKRVDTALTVMMMSDSFQHMQASRGDIAVLIAGDGDYMPAIESLASRGIPTLLVSLSGSTQPAAMFANTLTHSCRSTPNSMRSTLTHRTDPVTVDRFRRPRGLRSAQRERAAEPAGNVVGTQRPQTLRRRCRSGLINIPDLRAKPRAPQTTASPGSCS
jgi:hypothetical protein